MVIEAVKAVKLKKTKDKEKVQQELNAFESITLLDTDKSVDTHDSWKDGQSNSTKIDTCYKCHAISNRYYRTVGQQQKRQKTCHANLVPILYIKVANEHTKSTKKNKYTMLKALLDTGTSMSIVSESRINNRVKTSSKTEWNTIFFMTS